MLYVIMEQPVYAGGYGIRLIQNNPDEHQQKVAQQTNYIMASHHQDQNNQILIADESTGQHLVPHLQQPQYIQQDDGNQYLIQQQSPQLFYANIQQTQPNVNRIIQQHSQNNLMQQQSPQKVIINFFSDI